MQDIRKEALKTALVIVEKLKHLFPWQHTYVEIDKVDEMLHIGENWSLVPELLGPEKELYWYLYQYDHVPGCFNPYDGGSPPETYEKEHGPFPNLQAALAEIAKIETHELVDGLLDELHESV